MTLVKSIPADPSVPFHGTISGVLPASPAMLPPRTRWCRRHIWLALSCLVCVLLPVVLSAWYLWMRAADQYASEAGFAVRREETGAAIEMLGVFLTVLGAVMLMLYSLSRIARFAGETVNEGPMDYNPAHAAERSEAES